MNTNKSVCMVHQIWIHKANPWIFPLNMSKICSLMNLKRFFPSPYLGFHIGYKPFSFNKIQGIFTCVDKIHIHLYSLSKAIPLLATFLMKAKTSFKYSFYLLALLWIGETFTHSLFSLRATIAINMFIFSIL